MGTICLDFASSALLGMPYKDKAKQREAVRQATARWYERVRDDPDFIQRRAEAHAEVSHKQSADRRKRQRLDLETTLNQAINHDPDQN